MVIRHMEAHPELANRVFEDVGRRELRLMINFGFLFGFLLGIPVIFVVAALPYWWVLPICGVIVGWTTNRWGMLLIFEPVEPRQVGPFTFHGLFLRRRNEIADVYSQIIAEDIVTLANIGDHMLHGPRSDRTRQMLEAALRPAIDQAAGPAHSAVRVAVGTQEYDAIRDSVATEAVDYTMTPFTDPEFNRRQAARIKELFESRMRELPNRTSSSCCARRSRRTSGCCTRTAPCSGSARACYTWRSSESELMSDDRQPTNGAGLGPVENLARLGAGVWWRTARWSVGTSLRAGAQLLDAVDPEGADDRRVRGRSWGRPSPTRRRPCASAASGCWRRRRTSAMSRARTRPTSGSSATWRPTRRGS